ncbi:MAG: sigma factor [Bacillota bacterium]
MMVQATCDMAKVVRRAAQRKLGLFAAFHEFDVEDLTQEGLIAVQKAADRVDPTIASRATFAYTVAARRIIDVWRKRSRELERE